MTGENGFDRRGVSSQVPCGGPRSVKRAYLRIASRHGSSGPRLGQYVWSAPLCLVTNSWNSGCAPRFDRTPPRAASCRAVSTSAPAVFNRGSSSAAALRPPWTWFIDAIAMSAASVSTPSSCADAPESSSSAPVAASATRRANRGGVEVVRRDITVVRRARADAAEVSSEISRPRTSPRGAGTRSSERSVPSRRRVARGCV